jgi:hypothetical protein
MSIQFSPFYHDVQSGNGLMKSIKHGIKDLQKSKIISKSLGQLSKVAGVASDLGVPLAGNVAGLAKQGANVSGKVGFGKRKPAQKGKGKKKATKKH